MPTLKLDTSSNRLNQSITTLQQRQRGCQRPSTPPPPPELQWLPEYSTITREECRKNRLRRNPCLCDRCCPVPFNQGDPLEERNPLGADVVIVRDKCCLLDVPEDKIDWSRIGCHFGEPIIKGAKRRWNFPWLDPDWRDAFTDRELWDLSDNVSPSQTFLPRTARRSAIAPAVLPAASNPGPATIPHLSSSDTTARFSTRGISSSPPSYSVKCSSENSAPKTETISEETITDALEHHQNKTITRAATDLSSSSRSTASISIYSALSHSSMSPSTPYSATCYTPSEGGSRAMSPIPSCPPTPNATPATPTQDCFARKPILTRSRTSTADSGKAPRKFSTLKGLRGMFANGDKASSTLSLSRRESAVSETA